MPDYQEHIRVLRILEYSGPRGYVYDNLRRRGVVEEFNQSQLTIKEVIVEGSFGYEQLPVSVRAPKGDSNA